MDASNFINNSSRIVPEKEFQKLLSENDKSIEAKDQLVAQILELTTLMHEFLTSNDLNVGHFKDFAETKGKHVSWMSVPNSDKIYLKVTTK